MPRLMREAGIAGVSRRRSTTKTTTREQRAARVAPDLMDREFSAACADRPRVADIDYVATWTGLLYVAVVLDAFSRRVVGWSMAAHLRTELVTLPAVPARDQRPGRRPALIGAVARERAADVPVIRARGERCRAPCFGANVLLADEPRLVAKLHRPWPGGLSPRAGLFLLVGFPPRIPGPHRCQACPQRPCRPSAAQTAFARRPTRSVSGSF